MSRQPLPQKARLRILSILCSLCLLPGLAISCADKGSVPQNKPHAADLPLQRFDAQFFNYFDTLSRVTVYCRNENDFAEFKKRLVAEMRRCHVLYDSFREPVASLQQLEQDPLGKTQSNTEDDARPTGTELPDANICTLNHMAGKGPVKVPAEIMELLKEGEKAYTLSKGALNIALGAVTELWQAAREHAAADPASASIPNRKALTAAAAHCNFSDIIMDEKAGTVELRDPEMRLDVGAIAKGFAVEKIAQDLKKAGFEHVLLNMGGNVRAIGDKPDGSAWNIAIQNPYKAIGESANTSSNRNDYLRSIRIRSASLVTSGVYERYFTASGRRYHHIIDPSTSMPSERYVSVSILCQDSGAADLLSTALFNLSETEGLELLRHFEGAEALWCHPDGRISESPGFSKYIEPKN